MADDYTEMKSVGEIEGYQVFYMQAPEDGTVRTEPTYTGLFETQTEKLLPVVEENPKHIVNLQEVNESSPAIVLGETVKAEPADNGYEVTNQLKTKEIMQPSLVEGVTIIRNQKKMASEYSKPEDLNHEVAGVFTDSNVTALKPRTYVQNHQCISHASIITEPSGSTEVFTQKNVGTIEKELVEASVIPKTKHEFDSDVICAVINIVEEMDNTQMAITADKIMYWCNFCSFYTCVKKRLLQHIKIHRFRCHKCAFQSFSRATVIQHRVDEHCKLKRTSLKFCALFTDITKRQNTEKRKQSDDSDFVPVTKRKWLEEYDTNIDAEDKVASSKVNADCNPKTIDVTHGPEANFETADVTSESEANLETTDVTNGPKANCETADVTSESEANPETTDVTNRPEANFEIVDVTSKSEANSVTTGVTSVPEASNESYSSMSNSPMESAITTAITKNTSECSQGAKECLTTAVGSSKTSNQSTNKSKITVSSALCWNCGYCSFVTLNQAFLKSHLKAKHAKHPHKYIALLVSSEEEMEKIKASDAQLSGNPRKLTKMKPSVSLRSNSIKTKSAVKVSKTKKSSYTELEIDNAESDVKSGAQIEETGKNIPISYKCAHCNYNASDSSLVKTHLLKTHVGRVLYGLDMKAAQLKEKRYIFYCLKDTCKFQTKETDEYLDHVTTCINEESELSSVIMKSLNLIKEFIEKAVFNGSSIGMCTKTAKSANYSCNYCSFKASNILVKQHVLSNHVDQSRICLKLNIRLGTTELVHFCEHCLWESDDASDLKLHLAYKHSFSVEGKPPGSPKSSNVTPLAAETETKPISPSIEKDNYECDDEQLSSNFAESYYSKHVDEEVHINALSRYHAEHNTKSRPTRHAALKCMKNMKSVSLLPLYACTHCSSHEYGPKSMSLHLSTKHTDEILHAINVMHKSTNSSMKDALFCPKLKCYYTAPNPVDLLKHAQEDHNMKETDQYFQRLQVAFSYSKATCKSGSSKSNKSYQCLYCSQPVFDKIADMKTHLIKLHSSNAFIYCDRYAQKQGQPFTFFMCHFLTCDFIIDKKHDYLLHMLGHQKARIYECSLCQWFSSEKSEIIGHQNSAHEGKPVTVLDIDLDINEHGNIVRQVNGTVIKKENS